MSMSGGGTWALAPGQITDDSELAMCQLRGLLAGNGKLDAYHLAKYYGNWIVKKPFDIGKTTINGLGPLADCIDNPDPNIAYTAARTGRGHSSQSNGALMRVTPLAVWTQHLEVHELEQAVSADVKMTHTKSTMLDIVTAYCLGIRALI